MRGVQAFFWSEVNGGGAIQSSLLPPEDEVTMRIINRLGLHNTYFAIDRENEILGVNKTQLVHGYAFYPKSSHPYSFIPYGADTLPFSLSYTNPAGAMVSTQSSPI